MRTVPGPPQGEERAFDLPVEGESIRVVIRQPTEREKRVLWRKVTADQLVEIDGENYKEWLTHALDQFFVRVEGYARSTTGGPVPIASLADLRTYGEPALQEAIGAEILGVTALTEEQKKTPDSSSATGSPETQASHGTAESAAASNSADHAGVMDLCQTLPSSAAPSGAQ